METVTSLIPQDVRNVVDRDVRALLSGAKIEKITDNIQRENLNELLKSLARHRIYLEAERKKAKDPLIKQGREIDCYFNPITEGLKNLETENGRLCLEYDRAELKKIEDARRAAEASAAAERARLEAIEAKKRAEAARLAAEAEAKNAAIQAAAGAERARLEAEKAEIERKANLAYEAANKKEDQAAAVVAAPVLNTYRAPTGIKAKVTYRVEITDPVAFITWCVENKKFHWLSIEEGKVTAEVKANEGKWSAPGARVVEESGTRINTRSK